MRRLPFGWSSASDPWCSRGRRLEQASLHGRHRDFLDRSGFAPQPRTAATRRSRRRHRGNGRPGVFPQGTGQSGWRRCPRGGRPNPRTIDGVDGPLRHLSAKLLSDRNSSEWEPSMGEVTTIGLDLAKHVFQVHGVDAEGATVLRKQLRRAQVLAFFSRLPPCLVGLEACATAHYWARELRALGHEVRLMPAQYVKAYIKRNKHDAADA